MSEKVDRNVTVHLRARQADIYEKALRNMIKRGGPATEDCEALLYIAQKALERAERIR